MPAFRSMDDLRRSLRASGLENEVPGIVASARPAVLFVRQQSIDATLAQAISKLGGDPDLSEGFTWPERAPFMDAEQRAADLRKAEEFTAQFDEDTSERSRADAEHRKTVLDYKIARLFRPFPLAFVAQLNLGQLASTVGLPPELPQTGLLSVFQDVLGDEIAVRWHEGPLEALRRRPSPPEIIEYAGLCGPQAQPGDPALSWQSLTMAEALHPCAAVTVPHHWKTAFPNGSARWRQVWDWFIDHELGFSPTDEDVTPRPSQMTDAPLSSFGDRLGGWPSCIQGDVEVELSGEPVRPAGATEWRHVFSFGAEYNTTTRLLPPDFAGDGNTYVMLKEVDLLSRRFEKARAVYQQT